LDRVCGHLGLISSGRGIMSVAWRPDSEYKAIWVGASFPAIVQTLISTAPVHNP
jgi:hypothetical protein